MTSFRLVVTGCLTGVAVLAAPVPSKVTFNKDVLPILQNNCQSCHRPGEVAPMSLMTYTDARPWAKAIKTAVVPGRCRRGSRTPVGHFKNDRTLSRDADSTVLTAWVGCRRAGRRCQGQARAADVQRGWNIKPDIIVEMPKPFELPAKGTINYKYILVKTNFPEDMWIRGRGNASGQFEGAASRQGVGAASGFAMDGDGGSGRGVRERNAARHYRPQLGAKKATTFWASSTPAWARRISTSKARPSSFPKAPTWCLSCTTRPPAKPDRRMLRRSASCWPRIRPRGATSSTPDPPR